MKYKFYSPFLIWFGVWVFISLGMSLITLEINELNQQSSMVKERLLGYCLPSGPFSHRFGLSPDLQDRHQFLSGYRQLLQKEPPLYLASPLPAIGAGNQGWRGFSFWSPPPQSSLDSSWDQHFLLRDWEKAAQAGRLFTILSYLLFVVGFGAICLITAIYQNYFRKAQEEHFEAEIEARNLRIQMLESNSSALDLKLQLLDQNHERTVAATREAQENIRNLEEKLQSEAERNEELQAELEKALQDENKALKLLRSLERDRQILAAEKADIGARLAEVEKIQEAELFSQKVRKARGRLRLHAIWLTSLYKNLAFSPRALQNIGEIQEVSEVFPSLPEALAKINRLSLEGLLSGEKLPPKSVARFSTQELEHFQGPFWEFRFSSDGRIFFGLSQSRTWNIDTILLKRRFPDKKEKYDRYLAETLGKDNQDLKLEMQS
jgi:DNA repair exonuclease SbcCD ATPase subunit